MRESIQSSTILAYRVADCPLRNTFGIPDVPSEPCLLLCPQIMLLSLVFADGAFAADGLRGPEQIFRLRVRNGLNQQELPIKESMSAVPLFRRLETNVLGLCVSSNAAATDNWLRGALAKLGAVTGFELTVRPYCFRRGNGEALDNSSEFARELLDACVSELTESGLISDSQRNLILQHASSAVFQHNYLSRYITQDTHAIYRGLDPQTAVMRAASGMSRSIDPRRPRSLDEAQLTQVKRHPEVRLLLRTRNALAKQIRAEHGTVSNARGLDAYDSYVLARRRLQSKKKAVHKLLLAEVQSTYRKQQALKDISDQLDGAPDEKSSTGMNTASANSLSEDRRRAINVLFTFATSEPAEECQRRSAAIQTVSALSKRQELRDRKIYSRKRRRDSSGAAGEMDALGESGSKVAIPAPLAIECLPTQCIFCLGNPDLLLEDRTKPFLNRDGLKRRFERKHLRHCPDDEPLGCPHPSCDARLPNKVHLRNHAAKIHKTVT